MPPSIGRTPIETPPLNSPESAYGDKVTKSDGSPVETPNEDKPADNSSKVSFDLELPSINLVPDRPDEESMSAMDYVVSSTLHSPSPSYNSLLHWGHSPPKDDVEYLSNKYSELGGELLVVEIPLSQIALEAAHAKIPQLGLRLAGHKDLNQMSVFVCGLRPGSIAERDGRIEVGDQLLEVNDQALYGLSHLNAAPIIRSVYLDAVKGSNKIFRKTKMGSIRFVIQRCEGNLSSMAAPVNNHRYSECPSQQTSARSSRRGSTETVESFLSSPRRENNKAKRSLQMMDLAFGDKRGPLVERTIFINLPRGENGFGFAIMEGSPTNEEGIYVKQIIEGGAAARNGQLCAGDRLIRVNRKDATNASYDTVLDWIRSAKNELRLQVSRWCFSSQLPVPEGTLSRRQKRFSAPQIFGALSSVLRGHGRVSVDHRDSSGSGRQTLQPLVETDADAAPDSLHIPCTSSTVRRASSPNLATYPIVIDKIASIDVKSTLDVEPAELSVEKHENTFTEKMVEEPVKEPSEPPSTRPIVPGVDTVIELRVNPTTGLGIRFIGGCETAVNVLLVHELYPNGIAFMDGRLRPGDHISMVNQVSLVGMPFAEAVREVFTAYNDAVTKPPAEAIKDEPASSSSSEEALSVTLTVHRPETTPTKWYDQELVVELTKKAGKGLGICIADRCTYSHPSSPARGNGNLGCDAAKDGAAGHSATSYGVVITELIKGSLAAADGRLLVHDQILSVNGEDTAGATSEIVGALLKAATSKVAIKVGRLKNQVILGYSSLRGLFLPP
ncbi:unnamed protein product [Calicophoron daubneyi]|uniref:PDZ domain-containing protein n=1 Tax=Calicophoron daubneyi TaxID=300641 RepID=A0AAV2TPI8_CALDB